MAQINTVTNIYLDPADRGQLLLVTDEAATTINKVITVPAGKLWDLLAVRVQVVASVDAGNRQIVFELREPDYDIYHSIPAASVQIASATEFYHGQLGAGGGPTEDVATYHFLPLPGYTLLPAGHSFKVHDSATIDDGTQSQGTLTMDTQPTAGETITINGEVLTWVASGATLVAGNLELGANVAASQLVLNAAVGATPQAEALTHSVSVASRIAMGCIGTDFAANVMVFTAVAAGTAGDAITTVTSMAGGANAFDAATLGTTTAGVDADDASDVQMQVLEFNVRRYQSP